MEGAAMNNGTSDGEEKLWEKPWSLEEMRRGAQDWSLASDAGMLQYLQQFSQRLITRTHQIQEEVNGLLHETKMTGVRISNSFNDFIMLANTQFVENRVYDEDMTTENAEKNEKPSDKEKTKEEREAELIPRMTTAIRTGLQVIDTAFEKLDMNEANSDSDEEETPYKADPLLEAKDPYLARPLPYLIGSQAFFKDDDVGLVDVLSDEEEMSDHGSISESDSGEEEEEESVRGHPVSQQHHFSDSSSQYESEDSEGDLFGSVKQNEEELFDEEEGSSEEKEEISEKEPRDFAAELGAKINSRHTEKPADMPKKQKQKRKVSQEAAPFAVTPEEDDDLFAGKDSMFAPKQGLFSGGGGLFDDEDDDQGGMFPQETSKKSSGLPKPPPQRAAFSSDDESDSDEDDGPTEQMQPHKSSGVPASNKPYSQPPTHGGLFGGDEEEDLFASLSSAPAATKNASKVAAKPSPAAGLFGEEEADLFADESRLPPQRGAPKSIPQKTAVDLFMDDDDEEEGDLFADLGKTKSAPKSMPAVNKQEKKPEKKLPAGAVSMFGGAANPLLASLPSSHKVTPPSEEPEERSREQISPSKSDSLFGGSGDEDGGGDLFSVSTASPQVTDQKPSQVSRESSSLFGASPESDSSGDMFSSTKATPERKLPAGAVSLFGGAPNPIVASMQKPSPAKSQAVEEVHAQKKEVSLFGGSGEEHQEDLFAAPQPSSKKAVPKKNKGPSEVKSDLFSDLSPPSAGDGLFGGATSSSGNKKSTKQPLSLFDDDDDDDTDDDGSEHDQTETPTTKTKTKTVQDTGRKRSKSKSLFEDEDVLFGGPPPEDPGVDLFGPSSPIAKPPISIDKKTPTPFPVTGSPSSPAAKPAKKLPPGAVSMFGDSPNPLIDAINIRKPEQKLPPTEDAAEKTSPQQQVDEEDGLFSSKQPPLTPSITSPLTPPTAAPHTTPKKKMPPGAVSMFGGAPNPFMAARKTDEDHHTQEDEPTASEGEDLYSGDLTGTKLNRDLIAGTSSQGASSETEGTIGFDQPLKVDTLPTVVKNRAKIQNKRRPPTRKARVASTSGAGGDEDFPDSKGEEAGFLGDSLSSLPHHGHSVKSSSSTKHPATRVQLPVPIKPAHEDGENNDEDDLFSVSSVAPSVVSIDTPGNSDMRLPKDDLPSASDDFLEDKSKDPPAADYVQELPSGDSIMKRDIQPDSSSETTPKRHTSPVTSISPTQDDEDEDFFGASGLSNKPKPPPLEDEDLFNNSSLSSKPRSDPFEDDLFSSPVIHNALRTDDDLDIFGPSTSMPLPSQTLPPTDDDDLFGPVKIPPQPKPVVLGDHDIFGSSDALPSTKPALSDDDDIFSSSAKTILPKTNVDNTDDIFGSSNVPSKKNTANNDHDIFGNSNSQAPSADGDDIFGSSLRKTNEESQVQKKKETKVKKAQAPEIEDEDIFATSTPSSRSRPKKAATKDEDLFADDTDIFASIPKPTKTKTKHSKSKPADKSLFKDDTGDIFASASSKPKAKKSTKSKKSAAAIDKEPDIFDDPLSALQ